MKKVLLSAVALAMTATAANAASINLRHEYNFEHGKKSADTLKDAEHKDRIEVSHRFKNGIGFAVEAKYKQDSNDQIMGASNGTQANISYRHKLNDKFTLTPQFKIEGGSDQSQQFNLTLGYKVNDALSVSYRQRYNHYETDKYYNQGTFAFGYKFNPEWALSGSTDYRVHGGDKNTGKVWKDSKSGINEINFKLQYSGLESGWKPFTEFGVTPAEEDTKGEKDTWRPRLRVGVAYSF
ncbi:translocation/assembly module TamB domain-containing protein [Vibrio alginolyticus]